MEEILDNLYVGSDEDVPRAKVKGFAICSCTKEGPNGHRSELGYNTAGAPKGKDYYFVQHGNHIALNLIDVDDPGMIPEAVVNPGLKFIKEQLQKGKVLVHCQQGRSRGPTMAMMYLRTVGELPDRFRAAYKIFKTLYPKYDPGQGMEQYAKSHWNSLKG